MHFRSTGLSRRASAFAHVVANKENRMWCVLRGRHDLVEITLESLTP